ncbi:DNA-binding GntR family transcriptional regulator [Nocardioides marinisabuli]|uniref:DNA-binding GntR family transcriptional regulator n=1 Tax=Nocardioides marinisabuli TaxID=419476 RepID=A0A7Y9F030_9ACTN|nr:GntR family transcriptional regulator [Nocardioides marinisabuli]NYD57165.1 DNA-binding GntR family transcriptional regulator [Nocardioides marinisabuli]
MGSQSASHADSCLVRLRQLILTGVLLPGEKVNQAELADRLGVSRVPVREALASLRSEGLVEARPNSGFTVVRPTVEDLAEIYLMRGLLEDALLATVDLSAIDVAELRRLNERLAQLDPLAEFGDYREANEQFHFAIFDRSPQRMVRRQVHQLWVLSEFYRSIYIRTDSAHRRVIDDHTRIIDAIDRGDRPGLVALSSEHRAETQDWMAQVLARRS